MANKRMVVLIGIVLVLVAARLFVSFGDSQVTGSLFGFGNEEFQLNPAEEKKMSTLVQHPLLNAGSSDQAAPDLEPDRNPFIFGRPPEPEKIERPIEKPVMFEQVIKPEPEIQQRFSGKLFGMTEFPKSGRKTVLLETSNETMLLTEGELIDDRYEIHQITIEHVTIIDTKSGQELVLPFVEEP